MWGLTWFNVVSRQAIFESRELALCFREAVQRSFIYCGCLKLWGATAGLQRICFPCLHQAHRGAGRGRSGGA